MAVKVKFEDKPEYRILLVDDSPQSQEAKVLLESHNIPFQIMNAKGRTDRELPALLYFGYELEGLKAIKAYLHVIRQALFSVVEEEEK